MIDDQAMNTFEKIINKVGGAGKYQLLMSLSFGLKWFICAAFLFSLNFLFYTNDFVCAEGESGSKTCQEYVCSNPNPQFWIDHLETVPKSLSYVFDIYLCNRAWIVSTIQSLTYWGTLCGYIIFSFIADNYGRKKAQIISWGSACIGLIILSISFNIYIVGIGLFIAGMGTNSALTLHYTFIKYFIIGKWRQRTIISLQITYSLGIMSIAFFAIYLKNWRYLSIFALCIPACIIFIASFYLQQTPEFLLKIKRQKLLISLNKIARINKRSELQQDELQQSLEHYVPSKTTLTMYNLFKFKSLRVISYACGIINIANQFIFDSTIFSFGRMGLNIYINQIVSGITQIFAAFYGSFIITKIKRKTYSIVALIVVGLFTLSLIFIGYSQDIQKSKSGIIQLILLMCLRFVLSSFWGIFFVYVGQLFPSDITSIAYAYVSTIGTIGASASPYIKQASKNGSMIIMTCIAFVSSLHVFLLPQTKDKNMQLKIKQIQQQIHNKQSIISNQ